MSEHTKLLVRCSKLTKRGTQCKHTFYTDDPTRLACAVHMVQEEAEMLQKELEARRQALVDAVVEEYTSTGKEAVEEVEETHHKEEVDMSTRSVLDTLDPKRRYRAEAWIEAINALTLADIRNIVRAKKVRGGVYTNFVGEEVEAYKPFNLWNPDADGEATRADLWYLYRRLTHGLDFLSYIGVIPSINDLHGRVDLSKLFGADEAVAAVELVKNDLALIEVVILAAFYMATQIGDISYINADGLTIDGNHAIKHPVKPVYSIHMDEVLKELDGTAVELVHPGHLAIPSSMDQEYWAMFTRIFHLDIHGAPTNGERAVLAVSERGTNPDYRIEDVLRLVFDQSNHGKIGGKRQVMTKSRAVAKIQYNLVLEDPFLHPIATWQLSGGTIKVAVEHSPGNSGDGAAFTTKKGMRRLLMSIGLTGAQANNVLRKAYALHNNILTGFGFFKGNIFLMEKRDFRNRFGDEVDIVFDAAAFSSDHLAEEHWDRGAFLFNPIGVNTDKQFRVAGAEQLAFVLLKVVDPNYLELIPEVVLTHLKEAFEKDYAAHMAEYDWNTAFELPDTGEAQDFDEEWDFNPPRHDDDLLKGYLNRERSAFYALSTGMFASRTGMLKYAGHMYWEVKRLLEEKQKKGYTGLLASIGAARVTAGHYSPVKPDAFSLYPLRKKGDKRPWLLFIDDALMTNPTFQFLMELVDSDDTAYWVTLYDESGYYVYLFKIPTSPNAGVILPVSEDIANAMGTIPMPMKVATNRFSWEEVERQLAKSQQRYVPVPIGEAKYLDSKYRPNQYRGKEIRVSDKTTTMDYAHDVAKFLPVAGILGWFSNLVTLMDRSGLWMDEDREDYIDKACVMISTAVDAGINHDSTIQPMTQDLADLILTAAHNGAGLDTKFLAQESKQGLVKYLSRRYKQLLADKVLDGTGHHLLVDGVFTPAHADQWDANWEKVNRIPQDVITPAMKVTALLEAVSNGPVRNYIAPVFDTRIQTLVDRVWHLIQEARQTQMSWQERELFYLDRALQIRKGLAQLEDYIPGTFSILLAQRHATSDSFYSTGRRIDEDGFTPTNIAMPMLEYMGEEELAPFFNTMSLPTVFIQLSGTNTLEEGENYIFRTDLEHIQIISKQEVSDDDFASLDEVAAVARTPKTKEWATVANGATMTFVGFVAWSLNGQIGEEVVDPTAVFVPDMTELLDWGV